MQPFRLWLLLWLATLLLSISGQENYIVTGIDFHGNETFSPVEFNLYMSTYPTGWFSRAIMRKDPFRYSEEVFQDDLKRIKKFYQTEGFLQVSVERGRPDIKRSDKHLVLHMEIDEGPPVLVGEINFNTSAAVSAHKSICDSVIVANQDIFLLKRGNRFRDADLRADKQTILSALNNLGFPLATAKEKLELAEDMSEADIFWEIETGPRCQFGEVTVTGNERYSDELIKRQLDFSPGDLLSQAKINRTQKQIFGLGTFQIVVVTPLLNERVDTVVPIRIQVREAPQWMTKFGVGYGNEERVRLFTDTRRFAFLGGARRINVYTKYSAIEPYNIDVTFTQPAFFSPKNTAIVNPFILKQEEPGYTVERLGNRLSLQRQFTDFTTTSFSYTFERVDAISASGDTPVDLLDDGLYNKSSITGRIIRNNSAPLMSPTGGMFTAFSSSYSGLGLGSRFHFTPAITRCPEVFRD